LIRPSLKEDLKVIEAMNNNRPPDSQYALVNIAALLRVVGEAFGASLLNETSLNFAGNRSEQT
jgi:hypothetical protein